MAKILSIVEEQKRDSVNDMKTLSSMNTLLQVRNERENLSKKYFFLNNKFMSIICLWSAGYKSQREQNFCPRQGAQRCTGNPIRGIGKSTRAISVSTDGGDFYSTESTGKPYPYLPCLTLRNESRHKHERHDFHFRLTAYLRPTEMLSSLLSPKWKSFSLTSGRKCFCSWTTVAPVVEKELHSKYLQVRYQNRLTWYKIRCRM